MASHEIPRALTRRDVLIGAGPALLAAGAVAAESPASTPRAGAFDVARFIDDCRRANREADAQSAMREVLARALADPGAVLAGVGEPQKGGLKALYRSPELTILNIVWAPLMQLLPHDHGMWAVIGIYTGREDNIFWERRDASVAAKGAAAIGRGDTIALPADVVHSVANPVAKLTGAIHIYGGDFFAGGRTEWDPETLAPRPWSIQGAVRQFEESNARFYGPGAAACEAGNPA
jgi:predicted metal-dependent enzyme (double-stranded beta helix superfamily)